MPVDETLDTGVSWTDVPGTEVTVVHRPTTVPAPLRLRPETVVDVGVLATGVMVTRPCSQLPARRPPEMRRSLFLTSAMAVVTLPGWRTSGYWSRRSEEHTSELQSLMRISYAVFCLKKKKKERRTTIEI